MKHVLITRLRGFAVVINVYANTYIVMLPCSHILLLRICHVSISFFKGSVVLPGPHHVRRFHLVFLSTFNETCPDH